MANASETPPTKLSKNIVIFSDGTGQRGGLYFDEERTNVYKLYRATRVAPDCNIDPTKQIAFYDPGLGTQQTDGSSITRTFRWIYNFVSQATGLGITRNIIDCYAALIRLWEPGDRIFLFGFSRGAYTVRCLASVICLCGIPTTDQKGRSLKRDLSSAQKIASRAVKTVYQHVSSPRDAKYVPQRQVLAKLFRADYRSASGYDNTDPNTYPFFVGVFDTVAALSNYGSLFILGVAYLFAISAASTALAFYSFDFWYWFSWLAVDTFLLLLALYVYTHLKFSFRGAGIHWWETIHLTNFRQKFYDQNLNVDVKYARHAISIDELRADFTRVKWGNRRSDFNQASRKIPAFEQIWFAGNHADIGGGYPENESRLSDIALTWMLQAARNLGDESLIVDDTVLHLHPSASGSQHDETYSSAFRFAGKKLRDPDGNATLHPSVLERFSLKEVQQYDLRSPYRPEALRFHAQLSDYYKEIPAPHESCFKRLMKSLPRKLNHPQQGEKIMSEPSHFWSRGVSCLALLAGGGLALFATLVFCWQCFGWLKDGEWISLPLRDFCNPQASWVGVQIILDWILTLPTALFILVVGVLLFKFVGTLSDIIYKREASNAGMIITPSQIQRG